MTWDLSYRSGRAPWQRKELNSAFRRWFGDQDTTTLRGARVLVPGCGTSLEPIEFARRGAQVTCIDVSSTALDLQAQAFSAEGLEAVFVCGDLTKWSPKSYFDIVYEQTCLCALAPRERAAYETFASQATKIGGKLYILFMQTNGSGGPPYHCGIGAMRELFSEKRWVWPNGQSFRSDHPLGVHELGFVLERI